MGHQEKQNHNKITYSVCAVQCHILIQHKLKQSATSANLEAEERMVLQIEIALLQTLAWHSGVATFGLDNYICVFSSCPDLGKDEVSG